MDFSVSSLLIGVITGAVGMGYFVYGKKQQEWLPLCCGIGLMTYSWFIDGLIWNIIIGVVLTVVPWINWDRG